MKTIVYELKGLLVVQNWYGHKGYQWVRVFANEEEYQEIKKKPLQDYLHYGAKEVLYVYFVVNKIITKRKGNKTITITFENFSTISDGDASVVEKEMYENFYGFVDITYKH